MHFLYLALVCVCAASFFPRLMDLLWAACVVPIAFALVVAAAVVASFSLGLPASSPVPWAIGLVIGLPMAIGIWRA